MKTRKISIRVTEAEYNMLKDMADRHGMTISRVLRAILMGFLWKKS